MPAGCRIITPQDRSLASATRMWTPGSVIRVGFLDGEAWKRAWVKHVYDKHFRPHLRGLDVVFVDTLDSKPDVRVSFEHKGSGSSAVGTDCRLIPAPQATMLLGQLDNPPAFGAYTSLPSGPVTDGAVVQHELFHMLSRMHENLHPNADIKWNTGKVLEYFSEWPREDIEVNVMRLPGAQKVTTRPFDPKSIMMYTIPSELTLDGKSYGPNTAMSAQDVEWLQTAYATGADAKSLKWLMLPALLAAAGVVAYLAWLAYNS